MLRQRNILALSLLLGTSTLMKDSSNSGVQAIRIQKDTKSKAKANKESADEEESAEATEPKKNHPPKEVSHFTQDKVKAWKKQAWWRDNAIPTTPSYNDVDEEAYTHPMGSTFAQKESQWTDGNGAGSEKVDYWWHLDHHQFYPGEDYKFNDKAAKPTSELKSWNHGDNEPMWHPNGITSSAQMKNNKKKNLAQWWTQGNGQGSEKWDGIEEAARFVDSEDGFHKKVNLQGNFIPNVNDADTEPTAHSNGFTAATQVSPSTQAQLGSGSKWWTHGNGQGSEKWDAVEEAARFSTSQEEFDQKMKNGNMIPNLNGNDGEPDAHPMGFTSNAQVGTNHNNLNQRKAKWWTYGNGQGSEKWDGFEEAARFSNSQDEFHDKVKLQGNFIPSVNGADGEPTSHSNGFTAASQVGTTSHAQAGAKARWWTYGNGQGSEKWDGFEEAARFTNSQDEFDSKVALQGNFIPNVNAHDDEPTTHPMGYSFIQKETPHKDNLIQRDETNYERFWMNIEAANSKDQHEFNQKAAKVKIPSFNDNDGQPEKSQEF